MTELTDRQYQALRFIGDRLLHGEPAPTLREIGAGLGIRSTNGVNDHLRALVRKGFITRDELRARCIRLTPDGFARLGAPVPKLNFRTSLLERLLDACQRWEKAESSQEATMANFAMREAVKAIDAYDSGKAP